VRLDDFGEKGLVDVQGHTNRMHQCSISVCICWSTGASPERPARAMPSAGHCNAPLVVVEDFAHRSSVRWWASAADMDEYEVRPSPRWAAPPLQSGLVVAVACALGGCADGSSSNPSGSGATGTRLRDPSATDAAPPLEPRPAGEWLRLTDDFATEGCDVVNGTDFEAIVRLDRRLERVSERGRDVPDQLLDLWLDEDFNILSEPAGAPVGRVSFAQDSEGYRRPWLLHPDGSAWSLGAAAANMSPLQYTGVPCEACPFVADATTPLCEASVAERIPNGAAYPERLVVLRSGPGDRAADAGAPLLPTREFTGPVIVIGDAGRPAFAGQNVQWVAFRRGSVTCDAIHGADFVAVTAGSRLVVVAQRSLDEPDRLIDAALQVTPASGPGITAPFAGSWRLVSTADGTLLADLVYTRGADGSLALWLAAPDGSAWALDAANAGTLPNQFPNAACDACEFIDQLAPGACN
jgi:hypothetical protein